MKNPLKILVAGALALFIAACGSSTSGVSESFIEALAKGDKEKASSYAYFSDEIGKRGFSRGEYFNSQVDEFRDDSDRNGGIDSIEVTDYKEDGNEANVRVLVRYNFEKVNIIRLFLIKSNGEWKVANIKIR